MAKKFKSSGQESRGGVARRNIGEAFNVGPTGNWSETLMEGIQTTFRTRSKGGVQVVTEEKLKIADEKVVRLVSDVGEREPEKK